LLIIYRTFIDLKELPVEWKHSVVTPKFKKGNPSLPSNYRPIALTCTACKILESIISAELNDFLLQHNLISRHQHGFLKRHSTSTNLLESLKDWTLSLSKTKSVIIASIDFQRAFDSISHIKLIHKLKGYGISGNLLFWLQSFLNNHSQCVRAGSALSSSCSVSSGVPQGSVVGVLLFIIYLNDITDHSDHAITTQLFADDLKIYTEISFHSSSTAFQYHLHLIYSWSVTWQLTIAYSKCNTMQLGAHFGPGDLPELRIADHHLNNVTSLIDLGEKFDNQLKFSDHIHDIINRAYQRSNLIFRCFLSKDPYSLLRVYKTYNRPILEYNSVVWSPSQICLINALEAVQRAFTKRLPSFQNLSYHERITNLQLQTLEHSRLVTDLYTCHCIINGHSALQFNDFFTNSHRSNLHGHSKKLEMPLCKYN
jgi:ribonuclease P/MRP protein subunit RPP40